MFNASRRSSLHYYQGSKTAADTCDASPHRLIAMLYDGLLQRLGQARNAIEHRDLKVKIRSIDSSVAIINYLRMILDQDAGGEFSRRMTQLYDYMMRRLVHANAANDARSIDEVISLLTPVKSAWDAIEPAALDQTRPSGIRSAA